MYAQTFHPVTAYTNHKPEVFWPADVVGQALVKQASRGEESF
jgi:hypothetical protein